MKIRACSLYIFGERLWPHWRGPEASKSSSAQSGFAALELWKWATARGGFPSSEATPPPGIFQGSMEPTLSLSLSFSPAVAAATAVCLSAWLPHRAADELAFCRCDEGWGVWIFVRFRSGSWAFVRQRRFLLGLKFDLFYQWVSNGI